MRKFLLTAIAATALALPAVAEDGDVGAFFVGQELDTSFEASRSRLSAQGYSDIEMENGSAYHLTARNAEGREVLLAIDPQSGEPVVTSP